MNTIQQGSTGPDVLTWQKDALRMSSPDGVFGPATRTLTIEWQAQHNIPSDGVVGPATWKAAGFAPSTSAVPTPEHHDIYQTYVPEPGDYGYTAPSSPATPAGSKAAPPITVTTKPKPTLRQGSSGADVSTWQDVLGISPSGSFDAATKAATIAWQKSHGLGADGVVGPATWKAAGFLGASSAAAPAYTPSKSPTPKAAAPHVSASLLPSLSGAWFGVPKSVWAMGATFGLFLALHHHGKHAR